MIYYKNAAKVKQIIAGQNGRLPGRKREGLKSTRTFKPDVEASCARILAEAIRNQLNEYDTSFRLAIRRCWEIFGDRAFEKNADGSHAKRRRKNSTLFEVWMNALSRLSEEQMQTLNSRKEILVKKHIHLMANDNDYFRSITYSTQKKDHYRTRRDKVQQLIMEVIHA